MKPAPHQPNAPEQLQAQFKDQAEQARAKRETLLRYAEHIHQQQRNWISRLMASPEEKQLRSTFWEKQNEALGTALDDRNEGLKTIGDAQLAFIREVCQSLLISARSQIQLNRTTTYMKRSMQLNEHLGNLNTEFARLIEQHMQYAAQCSGALQQLQYQQIDHMLERWNDTYTVLLDEFADIVRNRKA
jgi:hypothetical protein